MPATPESFSSLDVINAAFRTIGSYGPADTVEPEDAQDALARLNRFVSQLRTQEFTVPFIARKVFPITSSQNTYLIGPGGDFDTQRPQEINAAGLILAPNTVSIAITGASPTLRTFTVAGDQTGSIPSGSDLIVMGSTGNNGSYTIVSSVFGTSTTIQVADPVLSAVADGTITVFGEITSTTEIPIGALTDNGYQAIQVKALGNTQFTQLYYNPTYAGGVGTIWLWPTPNTAANALAIYVDQYVDGFANLTTTYFFPPGYADLFEYGLANRLLAPYSVKDPAIVGEVKQGLSTAAMLVKRQNVKWNDLATDTAVIGGAGGVYNILSGSINTGSR